MNQVTILGRKLYELNVKGMSRNKIDDDGGEDDDDDDDEYEDVLNDTTTMFKITELREITDNVKNDNSRECFYKTSRKM